MVIYTFIYVPISTTAPTRYNHQWYCVICFSLQLIRQRWPIRSRKVTNWEIRKVNVYLSGARALSWKVQGDKVLRMFSVMKTDPVQSREKTPDPGSLVCTGFGAVREGIWVFAYLSCVGRESRSRWSLFGTRIPDMLHNLHRLPGPTGAEHGLWTSCKRDE